VIAYAVWTFAGSPEDSVAQMDWVYNVSLALAGIACLSQSARPNVQSGPWIAFGIGLLTWAAGDIYYTQVLADMKKIPYPSWADLGYLMALPCFFVGVGLLVRQRVGRFTAASWFDGAIGALAAAAAASSLLAPALVGLTKGDSETVLTNLAYPLGDVLLIAFLVGALVVGGVRGANGLIAVGIGLFVWGAGDALYLYEVSTDTYDGGAIDLVWPVGALIMALGAYLSTSAPAAGRAGYRSAIVLPVFFGTVAAAVLTWDHYENLNEASVWLAVATILAVLFRLGLSFRENARLMEVLHSDSVTDVLTGLGNRRALSAALERTLGNSDRRSNPHVFALFDLDGFKFYNDSFGHPAGDLLLQRLGDNLSTALGAGGAFRLGGDEFCMLIALKGREPAELAEVARTALSERGEGFSVTASCGWAVIPDEADTTSEALRLVDQRMYTEKASRTMRNANQMPEIFRRIFRHHDPDLRDHFDEVADLALKVGQALDLDAEDLDAITRAAEFHDIGKIAVPDEILNKRGPLDESEWELMRRHTIIGDRILSATPAMRPVAALVRSSHERWDGAGYPDGLVAEQTPLGARIVAICDAFDAMTTDRSYQRARSESDALAELRACAGTQFDPDLVDVFCEVFEAAHPGSDSGKAHSVAVATP
jgi:diguanylate cyclase (GGDEF)-like protein